MPKAKARIIRCRTCGKVILGRKPYKKPKELILSAIRRHYKRHHPRKFRGFIKKALRTKREKGLINKHGNPVSATVLAILGIGYETWKRIPKEDREHIKQLIEQRMYATAKRVMETALRRRA
jgi:hypothetical protein